MFVSPTFSCLVHNCIQKEHQRFILGRKVSCGLKISPDPDLRSLTLHMTKVTSTYHHQHSIPKGGLWSCVEKIMNGVAVANNLNELNANHLFIT